MSPTSGGAAGSGAAGSIGARIWAHDTSLWTSDPDGAAEAAQRLGWLDLPTRMREHLPRLRAFADQVRADGLQRAVVLGMGGSSLCVEVLARTLGPDGTLRSPTGGGGIPVRILDSTHPAAVADILTWAPPETSLYVVSSKSGTTTEPNDFAAFFEAEAAKAFGARSLGDDAGSRFVAVTDPDTPLVTHARDHNYRDVFANPPEVGGRYSALSLFGLVPAALLGIDLDGLLQAAARMAAACGPDVADADSPGVALGRFLGDNAAAGRDKVTVLAVPELASFGLWVEQLLAESTGKQGRGLLPVVGEDADAAASYGDDRAVVTLGVAGRQPEQAARVADGHPTFNLDLPGGLELGAEFFRWEFATAVAGHLLGVNAFDQPDVQAAKDATKRVLAQAAKGADPLDTERDGGAKGGKAIRVGGIADVAPTAAALRDLLTSVAPPGYVALLAYLHPDQDTQEQLAELAAAIRHATRAATTIGFGPRYLHSTGQLHKGGPDGGRFIVLTGTTGTDPAQPPLTVPGRDYTFATLVAAQAAGDLDALRSRGRDVLHVHLTEGGDLRILHEAFTVALGKGAEET
jgi:transaldolase / glucose-6-phosphate isomerase